MPFTFFNQARDLNRRIRQFGDDAAKLAHQFLVANFPPLPLPGGNAVRAECLEAQTPGRAVLFCRPRVDRDVALALLGEQFGNWDVLVVDLLDLALLGDLEQGQPDANGANVDKGRPLGRPEIGGVITLSRYFSLLDFKSGVVKIRRGEHYSMPRQLQLLEKLVRSIQGRIQGLLGHDEIRKSRFDGFSKPASLVRPFRNRSRTPVTSACRVGGKATAALRSRGRVIGAFGRGRATTYGSLLRFQASLSSGRASGKGG